MTDLEMMKYLLNKSGCKFTEDIQTVRFVRTDMSVKQIDGSFPILDIEGDYADVRITFDEQGGITEFRAYS